LWTDEQSIMYELMHVITGGCGLIPSYIFVGYGCTFVVWNMWFDCLISKIYVNIEANVTESADIEYYVGQLVGKGFL
jgi:hypothetical protein